MSARLTIILGAAAAALLAFAGLYLKGRHDGAAHERPKIEAAQAQAAVAGLESAGAKDVARQVSAAVARREAASAATAKLAHDALTSETGHAPLDPDRVARLRADDDELCRTAPELSGCAAD
jgi:putative intracellular protease/amidase